jgi:hypothetical protein
MVVIHLQIQQITYMCIELWIIRLCLVLRYARITVIYRNFTKTILCSFCEIMMNHRDSDVPP